MCALMRVISLSVDAQPAVAAPSTVSDHDIAYRVRSLRKAGYGTNEKKRHDNLDSRGLDKHNVPAAREKVDSRLYPVKNERLSEYRRIRTVSDAALRSRNGRYAA